MEQRVINFAQRRAVMRPGRREVPRQPASPAQQELDRWLDALDAQNRLWFQQARQMGEDSLSIREAFLIGVSVGWSLLLIFLVGAWAHK